MTKLYILQQCFKEAQKNGWKYEVDKIHWGQLLEKKNYYSIIFSHSFAKSFFQDKEPHWTENVWEYHIKEMVLIEDPLAYLQQFLND